MPQDYIADRDLYLDDAGAVVEANDQRKTFKLVSKGGTVPAERAAALGLTVEKPAPAPVIEAAVISAPPETTHIPGPPETVAHSGPRGKGRAKAGK